jgi:hypothetical protein
MLLRLMSSSLVSSGFSNDAGIICSATSSKNVAAVPPLRPNDRAPFLDRILLTWTTIGVNTDLAAGGESAGQKPH